MRDLVEKDLLDGRIENRGKGTVAAQASQAGATGTVTGERSPASAESTRGERWMTTAPMRTSTAAACAAACDTSRSDISFAPPLSTSKLRSRLNSCRAATVNS